jgi:competence protein ComFB
MPKKIKKDFDKEKMYSKIMPSIAERGDTPTAEERELGFAGIPAMQEDSGEAPALHNYMEDMMLEKLPHTTKVLGVCDCPRCVSDIMALALNQLPAAYAVAEQPDKSRMMQKLRGLYEVKVTASLIKAIQQVKMNPRH